MSNLISVVIPCFNESEVILESHKRITKILIEAKIDYELIFVDDGCRDDTFEKLKSVSNSKDNFIHLSRNFGHQIALSAGIEYSHGDAVVAIDADLQDPPEVIIEMINIWKSGADVVYGVRKSRIGESKFKLMSASIFYKFINFLSDIEIPVNTGDFRLMDRKVVDAFLRMPERDRYIRGMISWVGFNQIPVYYNRDRRFAGKTKYPLKKMINFAIDGIISFSTKPLKIATFLGLFFSFLSVIGVLYALVSRIWTDNWVPGWTLLFIALMLFGGIQLIVLGMIGEYIARISQESKRRPLYFLNPISRKNKDK